MTQMNVTQVRSKFREVLERVGKGEDIEITQDGKVVAALLHPERARLRRTTPALERAEQMRKDFEVARSSLNREKPDFGTLSVTFANELVGDIRAERDLG